MQKKKAFPMMVVFVVVVIVACIGVLTYQSNKPKQAQNLTIDLYFLENTTSLIKPEQREIKGTERADVLSGVLTELKAGPKTEGFTGLIPAKVMFLGVTLNDTVATVDVSEDYLAMKPGEELLARASIVWTLTGLEFVNTVKITVGGRELTKPNGEPMGEMGRKDIVIDATLSPEPVNYAKVKLYFTNADATGLEAEEREIQVNPNEPVEKYVLEQLIAGPQKEGLISTIPAETKIRDIKTVDGICYIDLSSEFVTKHSGGSTGEILTIYSIVNTLTELNNIKKVQFLVEGEKLEEYKGHLDFSKPFEAMEVNV